MDIVGIKLKYLFEKKNDYGTNHFFELLDEKPLKDLSKNMRMHVWEYNEKYYLKFSDKQVFDYSIDGSEITQFTFIKDVPYIMGLTFTNYEFEKIKNRLQDIRFLK